MADHLCPVCATYGVSSKEKISLRLYENSIACHGCGAKLTLGFWECLVSYALLAFFTGIGFWLQSAWGLAVFVFVGVTAAFYWQIKFVPLVPSIAHKSHKPTQAKGPE